MTLIQAQTRFIERCNSCHPGHINRVRRAAWKQLATWAHEHGFDTRIVCKDADDMAKLERAAED